MQDDYERSGVEIDVAFGTKDVDNGARSTGKRRRKSDEMTLEIWRYEPKKTDKDGLALLLEEEEKTAEQQKTAAIANGGILEIETEIETTWKRNWKRHGNEIDTKMETTWK
jgi:hypothetical protein